MRQIRALIFLYGISLISGLAQAAEAKSESPSLWRPEWTAISIRTSIIIAMGVVFFILLKIAVAGISNAISKTDGIRESGSVLRVKTFLHLVNWTGSIVIILSVTYMVLEGIGINMAPLIAGAGIVSLAFGFGGQYLIRDIINGIFILVEGQYRIHDVVKIGEHGGLVEGVNLRHTRLRDLEGRVIYIPNGEIKSVINFTKEHAMALLDIGVAYKENVDKVMEVLKEIAAEMREDAKYKRMILDDLEMLGVDAFDDSQVTIKCRMKTRPIKQWEVSREFRRRIKNRFDELGIEIPFPHQTLYFGTDKDNDFLKEALLKKSISEK